MALPVKMEENERGVMALHGLTGGIIATVLLLSILAVLTMAAISTQQANAENYYEVNQDLHAIKAGSSFSNKDQQDGTQNHKMWINK
jgi:succinate dehydrogenase/fumarate reductase cytochrome b subunit